MPETSKARESMSDATWRRLARSRLTTAEEEEGGPWTAAAEEVEKSTQAFHRRFGGDVWCRRHRFKALVFYYPFAGRLREGPNRKLLVERTGEGVVFVEAEAADVTLEEFGDALSPPFPCFSQLLIDIPRTGTAQLLNRPLLFIQPPTPPLQFLVEESGRRRGGESEEEPSCLAEGRIRPVEESEKLGWCVEVRWIEAVEEVTTGSERGDDAHKEENSRFAPRPTEEDGAVESRCGKWQGRVEVSALRWVWYPWTAKELVLGRVRVWSLSILGRWCLAWFGMADPTEVVVEVHQGGEEAGDPVEEEEIVVLEEEEETVTATKSHGLLCRVLGTKHMNPQAFTSMMRNLWCPLKGLEATQINRNLFLFRFQTARDLKKVMDAEPWFFERQLVLLQELDGDEQFLQVHLHMAPIWVRIYDVPWRARVQQNVLRICRKVGTFVEFDEDGVKGVGSFIRAMVKVDIDKPLAKEIITQKADGSSVRIYFRYKRLPNFCYHCGRLGLLLKDCMFIDDEGEDDEIGTPYGEWLRASPKKPFRLKAKAPLPIDSGRCQTESTGSNSLKQPKLKPQGLPTKVKQKSSRLKPISANTSPLPLPDTTPPLTTPTNTRTDPLEDQRVPLTNLNSGPPSPTLGTILTHLPPLPKWKRLARDRSKTVASENLEMGKRKADVTDMERLFVDYEGVGSGRSGGLALFWKDEWQTDAGCILERLDRAVASDAWKQLFPEACVYSLPREQSDHSPIKIKLQQQCPRSQRPRKLFRFESMWTREANFEQAVSDAWKSDVAAPLPTSLCDRIALCGDRLQS
ncbi:hypothetical protein Tsubulata_000840 [Turnera subulata]|uniref:CCHC-type domain-containing protein n=1 Tax=Turnera subulata TaxID=218843 RepID=A0A9Q0GAA7_9ROSI|nr:hypothetical protein Tsubulata_000840 [Turnera subulata]